MEHARLGAVSDIEALRALMEADRWVDRVLAQRSHLPEISELNDTEVQLRALSRQLRESQDALAPVRGAYEVAQRESERLRARVSGVGATLGASTANARELSALQGELSHLRELVSGAEDRELALMEQLEPLEEALTHVKVTAQPNVVRRAELKTIIESLQSSLDEELLSLRVLRTDKAAAVDAQLLVRYESALARVGVSGAAQVDSGRCDGCRIMLSPLDFDRWKTQLAGAYMVCAECGRLLLS